MVTPINQQISRRHPSQKRLQQIIITYLLAIGLLLNPSLAHAQLVGDQPNKFSDLEPIIGNIIRISVSLAGIALFVMLVLGGIQYLSSGGDPKATQQAKNTITYGIIGISLFALAWFALLFIERFTGVKVTTFTIPQP